ncbi:MAG: hypothetical protein M3Q40_04105 [Pseudomonadota bacterium]|nr:hypothetical protein [Pseudomonadota bacterium]
MTSPPGGFGKTFGKVISWVLLVVGVVNLGDALAGGELAASSLLKGVGFLLMTPSAFADAYPQFALKVRARERANLLRMLSLAGVVLVLVGFVMGWVS